MKRFYIDKNGVVHFENPYRLKAIKRIITFIRKRRKNMSKARKMQLKYQRAIRAKRWLKTIRL